MADEELAASIVRTLAERELTLGTVECGVNGIVSRAVFDTADGPLVLRDSLIVDEVEKAIGLMDLPRPQFKNAGDFSAKAARAAAREGRAFLGVSVCVAVWAPAPEDEWAQPHPVHIAVDAGREKACQTLQCEAPKEKALDGIARQALEMVQRTLS